MMAVIENTVRRIAPDRGKAKLENAASDLRALVEGLAIEDQFLSDAIRLFQSHLQRVNDAERAVAEALGTKNLAGVDAALSRPEITPAFITQNLAALNHFKVNRTPYAIFLSEHGEAKTLLESVCKVKLEQAQADAESALRNERARLGELGEDYDASESPVVRRARGKAGGLQTALNRIQSEPIENTFVVFSSQLLNE